MTDYEWQWEWGKRYSSYERPDEYTEEEQAADADILYNAMDGCGTNEQPIVEVLVKLSCNERQMLKEKYSQSYGEDLLERLKGELSSDLETTVVAMMTPARQYDAKLLHDAMDGLGTDEDTLIAIMCTRSADEIEEIKEIYKTEYETELIDDLAGDCSGFFGTLMRSLAVAKRNDDSDDNGDPAEDAQTLIEAGVAELGTDEMEFNKVLCTKSFNHLREVFRAYEAERGVTLEEDIENEMSSDVKNGFKTMVKVIKDSPSFVAERIYKACKGWGTDDDKLIRLIVSSCETDLKIVKDRYQRLYSDSLYNVVDGDCGGHYKQCLLSLIEGHFVAE